MTEANWYLWSIAVALVGLVFVALGLFFTLKGLRAKADIRAALQDENVATTEVGAESRAPVVDAKMAAAQADLIKQHVRERYGRFTDKARDDPNRDQYIRGLSLQNALNLAVIGFGVADLAIGNGVVIILLGVATLGFGLPATYLLG